MANVAVIGSQWGDEGKGKIVDWLSNRADVVVRFQGGHNAGHTLVVDGTTYKLSLLPSGVVRPGKLSIIGNGTVVDPWALLEEIARLKDLGLEITPDKLRIAENAPLILPLHAAVDRAREEARGAQMIGTTGRARMAEPVAIAAETPQIEMPEASGTLHSRLNLKYLRETKYTTAQ